MTPTKQCQTSEDEGYDLHARLLDGDPTAPADLALTYLDRLTDWLISRNRRIDPHHCATAAEDALLALIKNPASYQPERQSLAVYLRMSASGDLKNLLRSERRHRTHQANLESVEVSPIMGKYMWDEKSDPAHIVERGDEEVTTLIPSSLLDQLSIKEKQVLELMIEGERRTEFFAAVLGLTERSIIEQRREVKRVKDRLKKRLQRAGGWNE